MSDINKSSGSWVCTCITTGRVWEVFSFDEAQKAEKTNTIKVENIIDYLGRINREIQEGAK